MGTFTFLHRWTDPAPLRAVHEVHGELRSTVAALARARSPAERRAGVAELREALLQHQLAELDGFFHDLGQLLADEPGPDGASRNGSDGPNRPNRPNRPNGPNGPNGLDGPDAPMAPEAPVRHMAELARREHELLARSFHELAALDPASPAFGAQLDVLADLLHVHVESDHARLRQVRSSVDRGALRALSPADPAAAPGTTGSGEARRLLVAPLKAQG